VERVASQFFNELDNLSDLSQVIVLGATNREDLLDPALFRAGRLDFILRFPVPGQKDRLEILQVHTREKPLGKDVDLSKLSRLTEGMVGSQIASLCRGATMMAITEVIQSSKKPPSSFTVTGRHFRKVLEKMEGKEGSSRVKSR
jgi:transitional endoplasmic reticulum ATPase